MKIFVVNCGSSSIKYQLFAMPDELVLAEGIIERLGTHEATLRHVAGADVERNVDAPDHAAGLKIILETLVDAEAGVLESIDEVDAVGHRVVHGGIEATGSAPIDDDLIALVERHVELAPLHNPANLAGIRSAMAAMPDVPHVAVFDTAFLSTLPPKAYRYAVPADWYTRHHVRRYGFHGTSHRYVTLRAAELLEKPAGEINLITVHMGNGVSMTAVAAGRAVDHSMGMTPLEGLVMGTRSGDLDPAVVLHMLDRGLSADEIDRALNERSGLLGLSELSNDMRDLLGAAEAGNEKAELAVEMFVYRIVKYVGAYWAILPGVDAVVLTGGIGENAVPIRGKICRGLARLGAAGDAGRNARTVAGQCGRITADDSALAIWVIPTNEELMIARDTAEFAGAE